MLSTKAPNSLSCCTAQKRSLPASTSRKTCHRIHAVYDEGSSKGLTSVDLGGGARPSKGSVFSGSQPEKAVVPKDVELKSELGIDYSPLKSLLEKGEFQAADDETRALLIRMAGPDAQKRGWVYFSEVKFIPIADLQTVDQLWRSFSNNKFGYSIQRDLWIQQKKQWQKFFKRIDWTVGENSNYRKWPAEFNYTKDAVKGHLPLTNALRGTQLFDAIFDHPAFNKAAAAPTNGAS